MATLLTLDGAGMATGATVSTSTAGTGDTLPNSVTGNALTKAAGDATVGDYFTLAVAASASALTQWNIGTDVKNLGIRYYWRKSTGFSNAVMSLLGGFDTGTSTYPFRSAIAGSGTPGQVRFIDGASYNSATNLWAADTWWRTEVYLKIDTSSTGQVRYLLYSGNSTTATLDTGWLTGRNIGTGIEQIRFGNFQSPPSTPNGDLAFAHIKVTDTPDTLIGPYGATAAVNRLRRVKTDGTISAAQNVSTTTIRGIVTASGVKAFTGGVRRI